MPAQSVQTDAFVLLKRPPSDSYQMLTVFAPEHGNLTVLQRLAQKSTGTTTLLDLFDEAALLLESSNQGRTWFVREARVATRHEAIGRSYDALRLASALAALVARNPVEEDSRPQVAALLRTALNAFGASDRPDIVYFKSVYRFARDEGYPVKEEWFPSLPSTDRTAVTVLLNRPLAGQTAEAGLVTRLQRRLDEYLRHHTEILMDPAGAR